MDITGRRLPRRLILATFAAFASLAWANSALGADPPGVSPASVGTTSTPPSFTISAPAVTDPFATIDWSLAGASSDPGASGLVFLGPLITGPLGTLDGTYTLTANHSLPVLPGAPPDVGTVVVTFTLDTFAAAPTITSPLPAANASAATFTFFGEGPTFTCSLTGPTGFLPLDCSAGSVGPVALASGTYQFSVTTTDALSNLSQPASTPPFTVDTVAPIGGAIAHAPVAGQLPNFTNTPIVKINLTAPSSDGLSPIPGAIRYALTAANAPQPTTGFLEWTGPRDFTVTAIQGAQTTAFLWAQDVAGNISPTPVASTLPITFDNQAPTVAATSFPLPGANLTTAFGPLANIQIQFSEPVQNPVPFIRMCFNSCGLATAGKVTYNPASFGAILDPATALLAAAQYEIELLAHIRDPAGNQLTGVGAVTGPGNSPWTFTTSSDATPPGPVTGLLAAPGIGRVVLNWTPPADPDLARITVLRGTSPPAAAGDATAARFSLPAGARTFTDVGLTPLVPYHYAVYAEDAVGNPSVLARAVAAPRPPVVFVVLPKPPNTISARLMRPKKGKVLGTLRPLLRWKGKKTAVLYNLQIEDLNIRRKVLSAFVRKASYKVPKNRLKRGHRYAWRVWAYRGRARGYVKIPMTSWFDTSPRARP